MKRGPRAMDGLFEMSAVVVPGEKDEKEEVVEFGLKSVFFAGAEKAEEEPMDAFVRFLHRQYDRVLLGSAIWRLVR